MQVDIICDMECLFIGGRLHGQWCYVANARRGWPIKVPFAHKQAIRYRGRALKPCLELQEIEALTGRNYHRDPGKYVLEEFEISTMHAIYVPHRFVYRNTPILIYIAENYEANDGEIFALLEHRSH